MVWVKRLHSSSLASDCKHLPDICLASDVDIRPEWTCTHLSVRSLQIYTSLCQFALTLIKPFETAICGHIAVTITTTLDERMTNRVTNQCPANIARYLGVNMSIIIWKKLLSLSIAFINSLFVGEAMYVDLCNNLSVTVMTIFFETLWTMKIIYYINSYQKELRMNTTLGKDGMI